jgi:hypothetical protein
MTVAVRLIMAAKLRAVWANRVAIPRHCLPTNYGEIAWDAGLEIRLERPVRVIRRANPARRKVKPAHPAGSKNACREQAQLPAP